jgi:peptidoglycan hydrolase CwlO-like protein
MTTSPSSVAPSDSSSNGASVASLPRWRSFLSMLNWRRDPGYEQRMNALAIRMQQAESEILRVRSDSEQIKNEADQIKNEAEQIKNEAEQIKNEAEQIKNETELIKRETERLRTVNAKLRALNASGRLLCCPPESNSTPATAIEPDCKPSSP